MHALVVGVYLLFGCILIFLGYKSLNVLIIMCCRQSSQSSRYKIWLEVQM